MTFVSILSVFGSNGTENKSDKFQKLFYDGLVTALGIYASDVDAVVATSAPMPALTETKKYGAALIHSLSSGAPLRALFQPELHQFQTAFEEAVAEAVDAVGPGVAVVVVVYAGEVLHSTGEWLLADSTFSGEQLHMWLDSDAASAWQPEIQKLTTAPSGTEPINIVVCTPSAGVKTRWPMPTAPGGSTQLVMLSKSRRLPVRLQTTASWRANGKLIAAPTNATAFEALHALSGELARLHWEHQSKLLAEVEQEFPLSQRSFRDAPPALYLLPSGHGGVQTQACGLFVVQGVNVLLGSAFADNKPPQWWQLVRSLDRLDAAIFPDWSAASIHSYRFLTKHLLHATSASYSANWLGCLFTPAPIEPGIESPLLLTPPTTATTTADPHRLRHLSAQPEQTRLFYKIGVGELSLRYLGSSVGVILIWHPAAGEGKAKSAPPLTIFLPVVHSPEASVLPASLLAGLVRMLRKVPEITAESANVTTTATPIKRQTMVSTSAKPLGVASKTVNSTVPVKTHLNGTMRNATPASTKPLPPKTTPIRTPPSRSLATRNSAPSRTVPSTTPRAKPTTATPRPTTSVGRHSTTTTTTTQRDRAAHPTPTRTSTLGTKTTTPLAKKSPAEKRPTPASKTEAKLAEHAAKVAKATAAKPGHEIRYTPAGRPSNLPPRRKVGEKTVMEELNELPEVLKTSATGSLAEVVRQQHPSHETEEEVSYPDSLHAEETETEKAATAAAGAELSKSEVSVKQNEVPLFHEEISKSPSSVTENHGLSTQEVDHSKSPAKVDTVVDQHHEDVKGSSESPIDSVSSKSPAALDFTLSPAGVGQYEDLEAKVSSSPVDKGLVIGSQADEHHEEILTSKTSSAEMQFAMPSHAYGHHNDLFAREIGSDPNFYEISKAPTDIKSATSPADVENAEMEIPLSTGMHPHYNDLEISKPQADVIDSTHPTATNDFTEQSDGENKNESEVTNAHENEWGWKLEDKFAKSANENESDGTTPECEIPPRGEHQHTEEAGSPAYEVSGSATAMQFAMPADMGLSTSPAGGEYAAHHGGEHEEDLGEPKSPMHEEVSGSATAMQFAMPADMGLSTSPADAQYTASNAPDVDCSSPSKFIGSHEAQNTDFLSLRSGTHTMESIDAERQSHLQPQTVPTDDEFPVHEISVGGGRVIPEVADRTDSNEYLPLNMPPIHGDLMYQLQTSHASQPADSTTYGGPNIGFMNVAAGRPVEENLHSPGSEVSSSSVINTETAPIPPGFIPEVVSTTAFAATAASPKSGAPSGFSSQHPLLYSQHQSECFEGEEEAEAGVGADASPRQKPLSATVGGTGDMEVPPSKSPALPQRNEADGLVEVESGVFAKEAETSLKPVGSSDSTGAVTFDPLTQWGPPQEMPAPVLPSRTTLGRPSRPTPGRSAALGVKASAPSTTSKAPDALPPGSPIHLDIIWVPGYIIRVPFAMATQFFTQVRARVYVLSGECLHPITGEALIAGISKWKPEEREAVMKMSRGRGVEGINVVPTDEPLEWVRWLRRSSGGSGDGSGTGEERLQAVGVTVHSSATLCDIHFSDNGTEITCPGTQLPI